MKLPVEDLEFTFERSKAITLIVKACAEKPTNEKIQDIEKAIEFLRQDLIKLGDSKYCGISGVRIEY
jgi:hypothetical protein